ncbi:hypothetical protein AVEN_118925-1 [Araneus ventricosus]|uniref:Uncharacterized protein n=1 Tax=Araneus ventricosus TaxID=182803 RepID=A0A4Y2C085_ARAVE|nr:hypothetical protein AVEN_118925-1 [Araneus ventricosus]
MIRSFHKEYCIQWRFSAQVLEVLTPCLENPGDLKIYSTYTAVQTDGELVTFGRGIKTYMDVNCSAMPTARLRHWVRAGVLTIDGHGRGPQNLFYTHRRDKQMRKLRHWVEGGDLKSVLRLWPHIHKILH